MQQPFHFLDFPKEIRLMIYELLPLDVYHRLYVQDSENQALGLKMITNNVPGSAIIYTCRVVYEEAITWLRRRVSPGHGPLRLIVEGCQMDK